MPFVRIKLPRGELAECGVAQRFGWRQSRMLDRARHVQRTTAALQRLEV
jgi:hypothetical protein